MAALKIAYVGGGSSRAAGTMASFLGNGPRFDGSEFALIDKDPERLDIVARIARRIAETTGQTVTVTTHTDQRDGLRDSDAVLSSFRPGGFEQRLQDELVPLRHGVIGQETQGPGGLMMAIRSVTALRTILEDLDVVAPEARIFNYTNPVNIVSQAVTEHSDRPIWSMCEGPMVFPPPILRTAGLDPDRAKVTMAGVNHNCWSTEHTYDGEDLIPLLVEADQRVRHDESVPVWERRLLHLAAAMESVPSDYFRYYYFEREVLNELRAAPLSRSGVILQALPDYWDHYAEQAQSDHPELDPARSRGGIHELELAIDVMSAMYNDEPAELPVNLPNTGAALPGFDEDTVVEMWCRVSAAGVEPLPQRPLPHRVRGIVQTLAEYQRLAAVAAWQGTRADVVRALVAHPFVRSLDLAERLCDDLLVANREFLPAHLAG